MHRLAEIFEWSMFFFLITEVQIMEVALYIHCTCITYSKKVTRSAKEVELRMWWKTTGTV